MMARILSFEAMEEDEDKEKQDLRRRYDAHPISVLRKKIELTLFEPGLPLEAQYKGSTAMTRLQQVCKHSINGVDVREYRDQGYDSYSECPLCGKTTRN